MNSACFLDAVVLAIDIDPLLQWDFLSAAGEGNGEMEIVSISFALSLLLFFTPFLLAGSVKSWEDLKPYRGRDSYRQIDGELRQKMFLAVFDEIQRLYRGRVDGQLHEEVVLLCPQTADFLYSQFTPTKVSYQNGSRPILEAKAGELTSGLDTERQEVLALLRFVRDLYKGSPDGSQSPFQGGTEEELMQSNPRLCESQSRVLAALCQVAGFPSRRVGHFIGGHAVTEVFFEEKWAYIDIRGIYFLRPDGKFASTWEVWQNPGWIESQSEEVKRDRLPEGDPRIGDIYRWQDTPGKYFHPSEVTTIMNYDLSQVDRYIYKKVDPRRRGTSPDEVERIRQKLGSWRQLIFSK